MASAAFTTAGVKTRPNATPRMGRASAQRVGQGCTAICLVLRGHLARTIPNVVHANSPMSRGHVMLGMGRVFASLVTQEISMSGKH